LGLNNVSNKNMEVEGSNSIEIRSIKVGKNNDQIPTNMESQKLVKLKM